jgi:hypothetical protein
LRQIGVPGRRRQRLGQPEVQHFDHAVVSDLDVGGFEIAVDDPLLVCCFERLSDLARDGPGLVHRHPPLRDPVGEGRAFDELQHKCLRQITVLESIDGGAP